MVFEHILNTKIFKGNQAEPVNQISTNPMGKIASLVSDPLAIVSPLERVAKLSRPTSTPTREPSFLGILKGLGKDIVKFRLLFFPSWKKIVRLVLGYGFAFFLPSIFSVC